MRDKTDRLLERIIDYCNKIDAAKRRYFSDRKIFDEETFYRDGCAFYIQQIGEAVKDLPETFIVDHPEVKWHQIKGFRNIIAHAYESIDPDILWEAMQTDIPYLKAFCENQLRKSSLP